MPGQKTLQSPGGGASLAIALLGATLLCAVPAFGEARTPVRHHVASSVAGPFQRETIDQKIQTLHTDLAITPAQEADWQRVADVMRRNETTIRTMVEDRKQASGQDASAIDDLIS